MIKFISKIHKLNNIFSSKIDFFLAYSADPDGMAHDAVFHLGLHCLA